MHRFIHHPDVFKYLCRFVNSGRIVNFLRAFNPGCATLIVLDKQATELRDIVAIFKCYDCKNVVKKSDYIADDDGCHDCYEYLCDECKLGDCDYCLQKYCESCFSDIARCIICNQNRCSNNAKAPLLFQCTNCLDYVCIMCRKYCGSVICIGAENVSVVKKLIFLIFY